MTRTKLLVASLAFGIISFAQIALGDEPSASGNLQVVGFESSSEETQGVKVPKKWKIGKPKPPEIPKQLRVDKVHVPKQVRIDKIYVDKRLRVGPIKGIMEVVVPICWGRPQDCRGATGKRQYKAGQPEGYPYYVVTRFLCKNERNDNYNGAQCEKTMWSQKSCAHAMDAQRTAAYQRDPCKYCDKISDLTQYWDGYSVENAQAGLCEKEVFKIRPVRQQSNVVKKPPKELPPRSSMP